MAKRHADFVKKDDKVKIGDKTVTVTGKSTRKRGGTQFIMGKDQNGKNVAIPTKRRHQLDVEE